MYKEAPYSGVIRSHSINVGTRSMQSFNKSTLTSINPIQGSILSVRQLISSLIRLLVVIFFSALIILLDPTHTVPPSIPVLSLSDSKDMPSVEEINEAIKEREFSKLLVDSQKGHVNK